MEDMEQMWNDYQAALRRFIRRRIADASVVDDLLQEIFMKISSRINTLKDSRRLQGWLYEIAPNSLIDYSSARFTAVCPFSLPGSPGKSPRIFDGFLPERSSRKNSRERQSRSRGRPVAAELMGFLTRSLL